MTLHLLFYKVEEKILALPTDPLLRTAFVENLYDFIDLLQYPRL